MTYELNPSTEELEEAAEDKGYEVWSDFDSIKL